MERLNLAQLNNALTVTGEPSRRQLSSEDGMRLTEILERAQRRWPNQDTAESMEEYLADFERLALKYSLQKIADAFETMRISPEQKFFPKPDEVAEVIERKREAGMYRDNQRQAEKQRQEIKAQQDRERELYGDWRARWLASGLTLAEFFKTDPLIVAVDSKREETTA